MSGAPSEKEARIGGKANSGSCRTRYYGGGAGALVHFSAGTCVCVCVSSDVSHSSALMGLASNVCPTGRGVMLF